MQVSKISLVDLAGSERAKDTGAEGKRLQVHLRIEGGERERGRDKGKEIGGSERERERESEGGERGGNEVPYCTSYLQIFPLLPSLPASLPHRKELTSTSR